MAFSNFNLAEILNQFTRGQKVFVLVFVLGVISITTITTTYFTTECKDMVAINDILRKDMEDVKKSVAQCQAYNEILIHNNLLIIQKTSELHLKLLGGSNNLQLQSMTVLPDSINFNDLRTIELIEAPIVGEDDTDELIHDILEIAKSKTKK